MPRAGGRVPASLVRLGFADVEQVSAVLSDPALQLWDPETQQAADGGAAEILVGLGRTADPRLAALGLCRLAETAADRDELLSRLRAEEPLRRTLLSVLGASSALGDHLAANPDDWHLLDDPEPGAPARLPGDGDLRTAYRRALLSIAACDLTDRAGMEETAAALSDLAAATLQAALPKGICRLAVVGMGKCGGRELNYVSDVDVIFVAQPAGAQTEVEALEEATRLATQMMTTCAEVAWPVDAALRPEGKNGPLVRTLASHEAYYRRWARTWEFQALLKARPVAGDMELGRQYVDTIAPLVWTAADRDHFVEDVQAMRRRVESSLPRAVADRELKLGPGGLRDVEFAVQLLQLVHGRADETLRCGSTLQALQALAAGGYVGRDDAAALAEAYRFLRTAEHRLQLQRLRRTHLLPDDEAGLRWLARGMGITADPRRDVLETFGAELAGYTREVRRLHEKLFYRPLLAAAARIPTEELRLTPKAARARLTALGFADPDGALRHLAALTDGVSRRAAIQRALLPALLGSFADAPDPDAGLLGYRQVSEALQETPWYLRLLRDDAKVADRLTRLLGASRYLADLLVRDPEALRLLSDDALLIPRPREAVRAALSAAVARNAEPAVAIAAIRAVRRHELARIASADLLDQLDVAAAGDALSTVAAATLDAALEVATRALYPDGAPARIAVISMGRLGGGELGYGSDVDVMFVYEPLPGAEDRAAGDAASEIVETATRFLASPAPDPPLTVDPDLRPEGRNGPLVRSLASYRAYYERWSAPWEAQALLRASAAAGDAELGRRFLAMIEPFRYPAGGLPAAAVTEIRRLKARVDAERLPRGADPATHTKLGRGGVADVEWTVQLLQLRHAAELAELQTPSTLQALRALAATGMLPADDAAALEAAWQIASRARNAIMLVRGRAEDQLPRYGRTLAAVTRVLGYPPGRDPGQFLDDYRRATRRARRVIERVFYG